MIDVVICGNIRTEFALYQIIREVLTARSRGLVDQIVLSTWQSETEKYPRLVDTLGQFGIDIVTLDPPSPYTGSLPIQHMQFWRGMQALKSPTGWVLRTRTDKALRQTTTLFDGLAKGDISLNEKLPSGGIYSHKIVIDSASVTEPFAHSDLMMLMDKGDARRILNVDAAFDYVFDDTGYFPQEARWFVAPVMAQHPELKLLFEGINIHRLTNAISLAAETRALTDAPEALFQYLGCYWSIAHDLFSVIDRQHLDQRPLIEEIFARKSARPWAIHWGNRTLATNQEWLTFLGEGDDSADPTFLRAARHRTLPSQFGNALARIDIEALQAFTHSQVGSSERPSARSWIRLAEGAEPFDPLSLLTALIRHPVSDAAVQNALPRLEAAADAERDTGGTDKEILAAGRAMADEAKLTDDPEKACIAFLLLVSAAWARIHEAMDLACQMAHEGSVSHEQGREAFSTVYYFFVSDPHDAIARYWYGIDHLFGWTSGGVIQEEPGLAWIREAAEMGHPGAQAFLESYTSDVV